MQSTLMLPKTATVFDLGWLGKRLEALTDVCHRKGQRYGLGALLLLVVLAKLLGEDRPSGIADWIKGRGQLLREAFHLSWECMPHHDTYRRIFAWVVQPDELDRAVSTHLQSLFGVGRSVLWPPICQRKGSC